MIYLPAFRFFGRPNERFFNFMEYTSSVDDELVYDGILYEYQPYTDVDYLTTDNLITVYSSDSNFFNIVKFAKPKRKLIFKNCFIRFDNMLFEFPENTDFINCTIYLFRSKIVKPPVNCKFESSTIRIQRLRPNTGPLSPSILKATRELYKYDKHNQ